MREQFWCCHVDVVLRCCGVAMLWCCAMRRAVRHAVVGGDYESTPPQGLCIDPTRDDGSCFISGESRIVHVNGTSRATTTIAGSKTSGFADAVGELALFSGPHELCSTKHAKDIDSTAAAGSTNSNQAGSGGGGGAGAVYCAEFSGHRIRRINLVTRAVHTVAGIGIETDKSKVGGVDVDGALGTNKVSSPEFMCWDRARHCPGGPDSALYIASRNGKSLRRLDLLSGVVTTIHFKGIGIDSNDHRLYIAGLDSTPSGRVLFACINTRFIYSVDPETNTIEAIAGSAYRSPDTPSSNHDGPAKAVSFVTPMCLVIVNSECAAYITDFSGAAIRRLQLSDSLF